MNPLRLPSASLIPSGGSFARIRFIVRKTSGAYSFVRRNKFGSTRTSARGHVRADGMFNTRSARGKPAKGESGRKVKGWHLLEGKRFQDRDPPRKIQRPRSWEILPVPFATSPFYRDLVLSCATLFAASNPSGSANGQRTLGFRHYGNRFLGRAECPEFFCPIFIANPFDRSVKRSSRWSLPDHPASGHSSASPRAPGHPLCRTLAAP